ncbi:MAG: flippase-like domain-containing protein [Alphaproteobacteria bacterium]|nr:flippase-like domain-containing protein [Alphaproteobacteria bacterium]
MKRSLVIGTFVGVGLFTALIAWYGASDVAAGLLAMGWGIVLVSIVRFLLTVFDMLSWRVLLHRRDRQTLLRLFWIRWVADSVNTLLPVARIGGEFLRAHMLYRRGINGAVAGASVMVDVTAGIFTQLIFSIVGVFAFVLLVGSSANTALNLYIGLALFAAGVAGLLAIQRSGLFTWLARYSERMVDGRKWHNLAGATIEFDAAVAALYRDNRSIAMCCFWRIAGWIAGTAEVWLILYFLGHPISLAEAFILESLGQAARSAGFMIPGGLGVQEGGLILIGTHLGLTPELALSLSLAKRAREVMVGVPCLIAWQTIEGRGIWQRLRNPC